MKGIETGPDKVKKICDALRNETLEPAKREADRIVEQASLQAEELVRRAKKEAEHIEKEARLEVQKQKNIFEASLGQACKQALEALRQSIEERFFHEQLLELFSKEMRDPTVIAGLITAVVQAVEKQGIDADLKALIPAAVPARTVNELLAHNIKEALKDHAVLLGPLEGGIEVQIKGGYLTLDLTDKALAELVATYTRKDFRQLLFGNI